jgi:hypothetical protein
VVVPVFNESRNWNFAGCVDHFHVLFFGVCGCGTVFLRILPIFVQHVMGEYDFNFITLDIVSCICGFMPDELGYEP